MKEYLEYIKLAVLLAVLVGSNVVTWRVHTWKDGNDQKEAVVAELKTVSGKLDDFSHDQKATLDEGIAVSGMLDTFSKHSLKVQQEIYNATLAKPAAPDCGNPFTSDFVRLLNGDTRATAAPGAATAGGPGQMHRP